MIFFSFLSVELPSSAPHLKATDVNTEISAMWKIMSLEEQIAATEDAVAALKERREAKAHAPHHVPIHAFHDMRANIDSIEKEVSFLLYFPLRAHNSFTSLWPCMLAQGRRCYSSLSGPLQIASTSRTTLIQVKKCQIFSPSHLSSPSRIL